MSGIQRFEDIRGWQKARELVREIYKITDEGPFKRDWGLRDQIRRAAVSAMSNIAEGFARKNDKEFVRFLNFASASASEVQSQLYVALDIGYLNQAQFERLYGLARDTIALIAGFRNTLHPQF